MNSPKKITRPVHFRWRINMDAMECTAHAPHPHNAATFKRIITLEKFDSDTGDIVGATENEMLADFRRLFPGYEFEKRENQ